jgi:hypothetical protein
MTMKGTKKIQPVCIKKEIMDKVVSMSYKENRSISNVVETILIEYFKDKVEIKPVKKETFERR